MSSHISTVSVVIPTYKASPFIRETLGSVFAQTQLPEEVIVVDDCSPDDTVAVVEQIARTAPAPLRVIRLPKNSGGPAHPLNIGIQSATCKLIATLDHDDLMTPNRLADQSDVARLCPDVGLVLGHVKGTESKVRRDLLTEKGWEILRRLPSTEITSTVFRIAASEAYLAVLFHGCYALTCSAFLFPRATWQAIGGFDDRIRTSCDLDFLQAVTRGHDIAYTTNLVAHWLAPPSTLYSATSQQQRFADYWLILNRYTKDMLPREMKPVCRKVVVDFLFESGYAFRQAGQLRQAVACQFRAAWRCGVSIRLLKEMIKIGATALWPTAQKVAT
jgi:glycosyltransferase involved in cell wall biosynthesis